MSGTNLLAPRWRGQPGRLEVWYATFTMDNGDGLWVHYETVAPEQGEPYGHGWVAWFPVMGPPVWERFGPEPVVAPSQAAALAGVTKSMAWELRLDDGGARPLFTFPRWAWKREVLPAAQVVPLPSAEVRGWIEIDGARTELRGRGALARIYGHGNAKRWAWLHADLGGGDVLEVVAAVSRRPGLSKLPLAPLVQLRVGGRDWPGNPLLAAPLLRARIGLPSWRVWGGINRRRLTIDVDLPADRSVAIDYTDPDGAGAVCTNSERADAEIVVERWSGRWRKEHAWELHGTAHAEVGLRPEDG
jgi:hypothetical protein